MNLVLRTLQTMAALLLLITVFVLPQTHHHMANALFVQPDFTVKPFPGLRLEIADRMDIPYKGIAYDADSFASLASFALSLNAEFGPLEENTFQKLQSAYCGWSETKSRVIWKQGRSYTLLDFLPPLLQATSGLYFQSVRFPLQAGLPSFLVPGRVQKYAEQDILLTSNCWGFAWEVLLQADNADSSAMTISTADPTSAWRAFTGLGFDLIQTSRSQPKLLELDQRELRNAELKGGDVLLVWHQNPTTASGTDLYLDHVATFIDKDVYYEKSGSGDRVPFRINTREGVVRNFPTPVFFWEWRRLVRNNPLSPKVYGSRQTRLKPTSEIFGIDAQLAAAGTTSFLKRRRFDILSKLNPAVAQSLSLQADFSEEKDGKGIVESQTYTGILVLEDLVFDKKTGRASLPKSAFIPKDFQQKFQKLLPNDLYI
jgi:hypothetical protein